MRLQVSDFLLAADDTADATAGQLAKGKMRHAYTLACVRTCVRIPVNSISLGKCPGILIWPTGSCYYN